MLFLTMLKSKTNSPAKINLFLYVIGRDIRGYHILQSLFHTIPSLNDKLTIEIDTSGKCEVYSNASITDNLVIKAAKKILQLTHNERYGVKINLQKSIPIGGGLGGGSSNAATTLIEINKTLNLKLSTEQLINLSNDIGDDVKFFLMQQKCVYFDGLHRPYEVNIDQPLNILLVKPNFGISTAEVFKLYREQIKTSELKPIVQKDKILEYILDGDNQLYDIVQKIQPKIIDVITELRKQKGIIVARMSGSGSTCFGIFDDEVLLKKAKYNISKIYPEWFLHDCTQDSFPK